MRASLWVLSIKLIMATLCSSLRASQARINKGKKCSHVQDLTGPENIESIKDSRSVAGSQGLCEARTRYIRVAVLYSSTANMTSGPEPDEADLVGTFPILLSSSLRRSWYSSLRLLGSLGSTNVSQTSESRFSIANVGFTEGKF